MAKPQPSRPGESVASACPGTTPWWTRKPPACPRRAAASSRCPPCGCGAGRVAGGVLHPHPPPVAGGAKERGVARGLRGRFHPGPDGHHRRDAGGRAPARRKPCPWCEDFLGRGPAAWATTWALTPPSSTIPSRNIWAGPWRTTPWTTCAIARKLLPQLPHHRLGDVAAALGVPYEGAHRALADCWITYGCYEKLRALALSQGTEEEFLQRFEKKKPPKPRYPGVPGHPFYQKTLVLTGSLDTPQNREAVLRAGGKVGKEVAAGVDFVAIPAPGEKPLPGKEGGPVHFAPGCLLPAAGPRPNALTWPPPPTIMDTNTDFWM